MRRGAKVNSGKRCLSHNRKEAESFLSEAASLRTRVNIFSSATARVWRWFITVKGEQHSAEALLVAR